LLGGFAHIRRRAKHFIPAGLSVAACFGCAVGSITCRASVGRPPRLAAAGQIAFCLSDRRCDHQLGTRSHGEQIRTCSLSERLRWLPGRALGSAVQSLKHWQSKGFKPPPSRGVLVSSMTSRPTLSRARSLSVVDHPRHYGAGRGNKNARRYARRARPDRHSGQLRRRQPSIAVGCF